MRPEVIVALLILILTPALVWVTGMGAEEHAATEAHGEASPGEASTGAPAAATTTP